MTKRIHTAVFPVAGLGTRFLPATKATPKELLPVVDKPLIQYALEEARLAGISRFVLVTAHGKSTIEDHFDHCYELEETLAARGKRNELDALRRWLPRPGEIFYTRQQEPLGLGHAVWCARDLIGDEPFAVVLADDLVVGEVPCLRQMVEAHAGVGGNVVAVMDVPRAHTSRYGILDVGRTDGRLVEVRGLVEKPSPEKAPSTLSIIGRYILQPDVIEHLEHVRPGAGGEIQLTDALAQMIGKGPFHGFRFEGTRFDCGDKLGYFEANVAVAISRSDIGAGARDIVWRYAEQCRPKAAGQQKIDAGTGEPALRRAGLPGAGR
ncbi:MAG TPA: UTP--glucose-1-phosphate uridylyltransferase GalU [Dongiaceae bacterium]|jgi:UTP--glucose-1-phosphate uridylyltransferase|nr:UTP--glucose-1-phosphate uridylyltransferase GalU [Dongiaceae bacterium]